MNGIIGAVMKEVKGLSPFIRKVSGLLFEKPELGYEEVYAAGLLVAELEREGFSVKKGSGKLKTAFDAVFQGGKKRPEVVLLAEYDALPEIGHACGHNLIAPISIAAAIGLKKVLGKGCGRLRVVGTPAEEGGGGKVLMIDEGWFRNTDAALMAHPSPRTRVVARMLAIMHMDFHYYGKASHAAAHPGEGINALDAVIMLFNSINAMRQQTPDFSRVHGIITDGGMAPNIIPEYASCQFYIRGLTMKDFREMEKKIMMCAKGAAMATGCRLKVKRHPLAYHPFEPNRTLGNIFSRHMESAGLKDCGMPEWSGIGSSDIGNLSQMVPSLHPEFQVGDGSAVNHSREFLKAVTSRQGTDNATRAAMAIAGTAAELFLDPGAVSAVKREFAAFRRGNGGE